MPSDVQRQSFADDPLDPPVSLADLAEQFVVLAEGCVNGARLAGFRVQLDLRDGTSREGVPGPVAEAGAEDDVLRFVEIGGRPVDLADVVAYRITLTGG